MKPGTADHVRQSFELSRAYCSWYLASGEQKYKRRLIRLNREAIKSGLHCAVPTAFDAAVALGMMHFWDRDWRRAGNVFNQAFDAINLLLRNQSNSSKWPSLG